MIIFNNIILIMAYLYNPVLFITAQRGEKDLGILSDRSIPGLIFR